MANFTYYFNVDGNFTAAIAGMAETTGRFNASVEASMGGLAKLGQKFAAFGLIGDYVERASQAVSGIVEAGANAELQLINLKTLFGGNADAAQAMYERISEYGKVTPYDKAGLIEAQRTMMSFGMSGEAAFETLQQIGDIAMGDSGKLQSLALAFAQMSSTGKLTGQDLMQMINAGFNPLNEISKATGKSVAQLKEEMSKGGITVEQVAAAFRSATSEGGLFYGAIDEASDTTAGKMASIRDTIEEMKVKISEATGDVGLWFSALSEIIVPISDLTPLFQGLWSGIKAIKSLDFAGIWNTIRTRTLGAAIGLSMYNDTVAAGIVVNSGFRRNVLQAAFAVGRFATVGIWSAIKGLGALLLSYVTSGAASTAFAATASTSFATFKLSAVTACKAVGMAIKSIPIIGWIAAAIAALIALGAYLWKTSATFRAVLKGIWAAIKAYFTGMKDLAVNVFGGIWDLIKGLVSFDGDAIMAAVDRLKGGVTDFAGGIGKAFGEAYNTEMEESRKREAEEESSRKQEATAAHDYAQMMSDTSSGVVGNTLSREGMTSGYSSGGGSGHSVTVNVEKLIDRFEIHTTNLREDMGRVKEMVSEALLSALNDTNLAV